MKLHITLELENYSTNELTYMKEQIEKELEYREKKNKSKKTDNKYIYDYTYDYKNKYNNDYIMIDGIKGQEPTYYYLPSSWEIDY